MDLIGWGGLFLQLEERSTFSGDKHNRSWLPMKNMLLCFLAFLGIIFFELREARSLQVIQQPLGITEKETNVLIAAANNKARSLGYKPEELNFELSKDGRLFKAYFYPKQKKGTVTYGGTLTIYLDQKGRILSFERGI